MFLESRCNDEWVNSNQIAYIEIKDNWRHEGEYMLVATTVSDVEVILDIDHNRQQLKSSLRSYLAQIEEGTTSRGR